MKLIRKALALMLSLCMVLALAACGGGGSAESQTPDAASKAPEATQTEQGGEPAAEVGSPHVYPGRRRPAWHL